MKGTLAFAVFLQSSAPVSLRRREDTVRRDGERVHSVVQAAAHRRVPGVPVLQHSSAAAAHGVGGHPALRHVSRWLRLHAGGQGVGAPENAREVCSSLHAQEYS